MMPKRTLIALALSMASALALSACNKPSSDVTSTAPEPSMPAETATAPAASPAMPESMSEAVTVTSVDLGNAVGADNKVTTPTTTFAPSDTIYAAVATTGSGNATVEAKWTYQDGQTVKDDSKSIAPTGPATTTFSISKPDGWPAGNYKVDISVNGTQAASKEFSVQK